MHDPSDTLASPIIPADNRFDRKARRAAAVAAALVLLAAMVWLSRDFGATWDERFQQHYGERVWDYWAGRLPQSEFGPDAPGMEYLYGGLVELAAVAAQHIVPADTYVVRHAVISVFGWAGIVFTGLLAARLYGSRAGWIAAVLLATSPRYVGHAMNNPKDIPFAAATMAVLYYALTASRRPPYLSWGRAAKLVLAIAVAIDIRPLGLMLLVYAAGFVLVAAAVSAWNDRQTAHLRGFAQAGGMLAAVAIVAVPAGTLAWPWAQGQPWWRPIEAFAIASRLNWAEGFYTLYRGSDLLANELPWHYVPVWLAISLPPVVLAGVVLAPLVAVRSRAKRLGVLALVAFAAAPIGAAIVQHATLYDGVRHLLFVVPPLVVLAGVGWCAALDAAAGRARLAVVVLLAIGVAEPLAFQWRNHPNQIVYFSPLMGGPRAAFARYEMDYWGNSLLQAVEWAARLGERARVPVVVTGNPIQLVEADAGRFRAVATVPRRDPNHHLDIRLMRGPAGSLKEFAGRPDLLYRVTTADGTPLAVVLPGPAFGALQRQLAGR